MGNCSPNRLEDYSTVYFDVYNVDANLFQHSRGQIQVTSTELVLYQKTTPRTPPTTNHQVSAESNDNNTNTTVIRWPLNGVRRYGYFKDIFLFESGRKCSTGEGLFAFKCSKAKRLNEMLHRIILSNAGNLCNLSSQTMRSERRRGSESAATTGSGSGSGSGRGATRSSVVSTSDNVQTSNPARLSNELGLPNAPTNEIRRASNTQVENQNRDDLNQINASKSNEASSSPYYVNDLKSLVSLSSSILIFISFLVI